MRVLILYLETLTCNLIVPLHLVKWNSFHVSTKTLELSYHWTIIIFVSNYLNSPSFGANCHSPLPSATFSISLLSSLFYTTLTNAPISPPFSLSRSYPPIYNITSNTQYNIDKKMDGPPTKLVASLASNKTLVNCLVLTVKFEIVR